MMASQFPARTETLRSLDRELDGPTTPTEMPTLSARFCESSSPLDCFGLTSRENDERASAVISQHLETKRRRARASASVLARGSERQNFPPEFVRTLSTQIVETLKEEAGRALSQKRMSLCKLCDSVVWREQEEQRINAEKGITFRPQVIRHSGIRIDNWPVAANPRVQQQTLPRGPKAEFLLLLLSKRAGSG